MSQLPQHPAATGVVAVTEPHATVCVYCASSRTCDPAYHEVARRLGGLLAEHRYAIVYGGGRAGSMGALAEGALASGGRIVGVIPRFMQELEWGHAGLSELHVVEDMRTRKHEMLTRASAVVALAGGCGTLEELMEAMTLKRLGLFLGPIVIVNTKGYYDSLETLLEDSIRERFMDERHREMWQFVDSADDVVPALRAAPAWTHDLRGFAVR